MLLCELIQYMLNISKLKNNNKMKYNQAASRTQDLLRIAQSFKQPKYMDNINGYNSLRQILGNNIFLSYPCVNICLLSFDIFNGYNFITLV